MKRLSLAAAALALALPCSAQFAATEVSGIGAPQPFLLTKSLWTYEDIPGVTYSFHRSTAPDTGFECILDLHAGSTWTGDTTPLPATGLFHYLVTAFDGTVDNSPGNWSTGPRRTLDVPCPRVPPCASGAPVAGRVPLQLVSIGPNFNRPMFLTSPPGDPRLFVLERNGIIRIQHPDGTRTVFLDFSANVPSIASERGALGLAFHPDYASNGRLYVHYSGSPANCAVPSCTNPIDPGSCATVSEYTVSADPDVADPASERVLFRNGHPCGNHDGGWLAFGPDGMLYFAIGDGGDQNDPFGRGQDLSTYLAKIMRIDVDGRDPGLEYAVPPDNPFVGVAGALPEIWSYGMRNPWRDSFDRLTGDLYVGDVGQGCYEEISVATASTGGGRGTNFGWRIMEGTHCFSTTSCNATGCSTAGLNVAIHDFSHAAGNCSVIGGYVYRGCRMPDWNGVYFFSDYCDAWLDGLEHQDVAGTLQRIFPPGTLNRPISFGEDAAGEIYVVEQGGQIRRIEPQ